jgi:PIN domain
MLRYTAVLDACVLVPVALADTLLRLAENGLYRPLWSDRILAETRQAIEEIHPGIDTDKRFIDMQEAFGDAMVTGWEELQTGIVLPDKDDRHVVAAGIRGGAQAIVTANVADFPIAALDPFGLQPVHPDQFLLDQLDLSPPTVLRVIREQAQHTRRPPLSPLDLAAVLGRAGVPEFADELLRMMDPALDHWT